jgi:hypothetical protein
MRQGACALELLGMISIFSAFGLGGLNSERYP